MESKYAFLAENGCKSRQIPTFRYLGYFLLKITFLQSHFILTLNCTGEISVFLHGSCISATWISRRDKHTYSTSSGSWVQDGGQSISFPTQKRVPTALDEFRPNFIDGSNGCNFLVKLGLNIKLQRQEKICEYATVLHKFDILVCKFTPARNHRTLYHLQTKIFISYRK